MLKLSMVRLPEKCKSRTQNITMKQCEAYKKKKKPITD